MKDKGEEERWYNYRGIEVSTKNRARFRGRLMRILERDSESEPYLALVPPGAPLPKWGLVDVGKAVAECVEEEERKRKEEIGRRKAEIAKAVASGGRKVHVYAYPSLTKICESYDNLLGIRGNAKAKLEKGGFRSGDKVYTYFDGEWCVKRAASRRL